MRAHVVLGARPPRPRDEPAYKNGPVPRPLARERVGIYPRKRLCRRHRNMPLLEGHSASREAIRALSESSSLAISPSTLRNK